MVINYKEYNKKQMKIYEEIQGKCFEKVTLFTDNFLKHYTRNTDLPHNISYEVKLKTKTMLLKMVFICRLS